MGEGEKRQCISNYEYKVLHFKLYVFFTIPKYTLGILRTLINKGKQMDWSLGKFMLHNLKVKVSSLKWPLSFVLSGTSFTITSFLPF